jgi:H+/Cl- antiporter ClcA
VAVLKPLSSAISIGSGVPFGAEGPIIMIGGGVGSLFAWFLRLSSMERKTLLVGGCGRRHVGDVRCTDRGRVARRGIALI